MNRPPVSRALVLVCAASLLAGCVADSPTAQGRDVAWLYDVFLAASVAVFLIVVGLMLWAVVRYRGQPGRNVAMPAQTHGNVALEITWWALPTLLIIVLAVLTVGVLGQVDAREEDPGVIVEVRGYQWGWEFAYRDENVVVNGSAADPPTIRLPIGETVAFVITSADVVHSFNIPTFLIKRDAVPGRENRFDVLIEEAGTYGGQCGEFCGLLHARQLFEIEAVEREAFDDWLAERRADGAG